MSNNSKQPAFPLTTSTDYLGYSTCKIVSEGGLTKREQACIHLYVPETGDADLDVIIRHGRRAEFSGRALQGILSDPNSCGTKKELSEHAVEYADALLAALEGKEAR